MIGVAGRDRDVPHSGVDIAGRYGDPVRAPANGWVLWIRESDGCVLIDHSPFPYVSFLCHSSAILVKRLQEVKRGQIVGKIGTRGDSRGVPHIHWGLCHHGCPVLPNGVGKQDFHRDPLLRMTKKDGGCFNPIRDYETPEFKRNLIFTAPECALDVAVAQER